MNNCKLKENYTEFTDRVCFFRTVKCQDQGLMKVKVRTELARV